MRNNNLTQRKRNVLALLFTMIALTACGKSSDSPTPPGVTGSGGGSGSGSGSGSGLPGGCPVVTGAIPFIGQGIHVDSANIIGGQGFGPGQFGMGGGGQGPYNSRGQGDGLISMNLPQQGQQPGQVSGLMQLAQPTIQDIAHYYGRDPNNMCAQPNPNAVCVEGMAVNMGHYNTMLYGAVKIYVRNAWGVRGVYPPYSNAMQF